MAASTVQTSTNGTAGVKSAAKANQSTTREARVMAKPKAASKSSSKAAKRPSATAKKKPADPVDQMLAENESLKTAVQQIEAQFGSGSIMALGNDSKQQIRGISTGSLSLDMALGGSGLPAGRIIEIYGPESSGKTTLALHTIAQAQKEQFASGFSCTIWLRLPELSRMTPKPAQSDNQLPFRS